MGRTSGCRDAVSSGSPAPAAGKQCLWPCLPMNASFIALIGSSANQPLPLVFQGYFGISGQDNRSKF
jgi:hypothetical protein